MDIFDRTVMYHLAHREFDDLARLGAWNLGHLYYFGGHMTRGAFRAHEATDTIL